MCCYRMYHWLRCPICCRARLSWKPRRALALLPSTAYMQAHALSTVHTSSYPLVFLSTFISRDKRSTCAAQVAAALAELADRAAGVPRADMERALALMSVGVHGPNPGTNTTQELKFAVKYARQLGVHVSPTTTLNGLVLDSSSSWGLDKWRGVLDPLLEEGSVDA